MVEPEKKEPRKENPEGGFFRRYARNPLVTLVNKILPARFARFKYKRTKVYTPEIKLRPLYRILQSRLEKLRILEQRWHDLESEIRPNIQKVFMDVGQYTSSQCIREERMTTRYGNYYTGHATKMSDVVVGSMFEKDNDEYKKMNEKYKDYIREIEILGKKYTVPSPAPMFIYFPDGQVHRLRVYGFHRREGWENEYTAFLKCVCDDVFERYKKKEIEIEKGDENNVKENLRFVREAFEEEIKYIFDFVVEELGVNHYSRIWGRVGDEGKPGAGACGARIEELHHMTTELLKTRPYTAKTESRSDIVYDHTYHVITPIPTEEDITMLDDYIKETIEIMKHDKDNPKEIFERAKKRANDRIEELRKLRKEKIDELKRNGFEKRSEEFDWGLDENGMPLEVDEHTGQVLLDKWEGRPIRKVPKEFIMLYDMLDIINFIHNEWDSYRDDLRDARYHPKSLTAVDYVMAANPRLFGRSGFWKARKDTHMTKDYAKYKMKLRKEWLGYKEIEGMRNPTDLSPAFDHHADDSWEHIGRKYYYDPVDYVAKEEMKKPVLTSRGLSNYIIWRTVFMGGGMKEFGDARAALELIKKGMGMEGFDTEPRMVGWSFNPDPFNITTIGKLNEGTKKEARE